MRLDFTSCDDSEISELGTYLFNRYHSNYESQEEVAQYLATEFYNRLLVGKEDHVFALIRIFRFGPFSTLPLSLREQAGITNPADDYWLALMGTYGDEAQWRHRTLSKGHQVFPARADFTPMLKEAFAQMMLTPGDNLTVEDVQVLLNQEGDRPYRRAFHIENAVGSPHIPVQGEFVLRHGIRSVVGFSGLYTNRAGFMCLGFSSIPINEARFRKALRLAPAVARLLAIYEGRGVIWNV
ncbi:MAG: hypothetical protein AAF787_21215 [Chloroflexota bacterium]